MKKDYQLKIRISERNLQEFRAYAKEQGKTMTSILEKLMFTEMKKGEQGLPNNKIIA